MMCLFAACLLAQGPGLSGACVERSSVLGLKHFCQSVTQTPSVSSLFESSNAIQEHVSDRLHSDSSFTSHGPTSLEQVAMGTASFSTGIHHPALVFQVLVHQLQHPLASHSSDVAMLHENRGAGPGEGGSGPGEGGSGEGAGGGLGATQPAGSFGSVGDHRHMLEAQHVVWLPTVSHDDTDLEQFFAQEATAEHQPVGLHLLPHQVQQGTASHSACEVTLQGPSSNTSAPLCSVRGRAGTAAAATMAAATSKARSHIADWMLDLGKDVALSYARTDRLEFVPAFSFESLPLMVAP